MTNLLLSSELLLIPQSSIDQVSNFSQSKNQTSNVALIDNNSFFISFSFWVSFPFSWFIDLDSRDMFIGR
jgi:hypothetical protein